MERVSVRVGVHPVPRRGQSGAVGQRVRRPACVIRFFFYYAIDFVEAFFLGVLPDRKMCWDMFSSVSWVSSSLSVFFS